MSFVQTRKNKFRDYNGEVIRYFDLDSYDKNEQGQLSRLGSRSPSFQGFAVDTLCYALASATPIKTLGGDSGK